MSRRTHEPELSVSSKVAARPTRRVKPTDDEAAAADAAIRAMWQTYKSGGDAAVRERLILHYTPLVKYVAGRVGVGLPQNIEQADLVSYGIFGLIDAIEKFDLERAIKFETYAISRIRGAIIDELRALDWIPRSVRSKAREVERAYATLEGELHRTPSEAELTVAARVLEVLPGGTKQLLYARIDLIPGPDGAPMLIELELTEPSLFFRYAPGAAERLADAVMARL